jgi:hypothetical protein
MTEERSARLVTPDEYAPTAMKPACPIENCPVMPLTMLSETARTTFTPTIDAT